MTHKSAIFNAVYDALEGALKVNIVAGSLTATIDEVTINNDSASPVPVAVVSGDISVSSVTVDNDSGSPVPVAIVSGGASSEVTVLNDSNDPVPVAVISGGGSSEVTILNDSGSPVPVAVISGGGSDEVTVINDSGSPIPVDVLTMPETTVTWSTAKPVSFSGQSVGITGTVDVTGSTVDASGSTVDATGSTVAISGTVDVSGSTVDASGSTVDASGSTIDLSAMTYNGGTMPVSLAAEIDVDLNSMSFNSGVMPVTWSTAKPVSWTGQSVSITGTPNVAVTSIPTTTVTWPSALPVTATGNVAHDAADSGNPLKIGAKAIDYTPDSSGEQGPSNVAANDRANISTNLKGELITGMKCQYSAPTNISTTYDDDPTTATSAAIDCWPYRMATFSFELDVANSPTDITIECQVSLDGTNWAKLTNGAWGSLLYTAAAIGSGIERAYTFPICAQKIRFVVTATGTDASNTITMANATLYMQK